MPHKKNPDVFELIRARCNQLISLPNDIALLTTNLPSGYHRDFQLLKEKLFPAIQRLKDCLRMMHVMLSNIQVKENILASEQYKFLFSVEEVNKLVMKGIPFRDAYRQVGIAIENNQFTYSTTLTHTHEGSIGNLSNDKINSLMKVVLDKFRFEHANQALALLLK
jgi:argininosuccinate lyase